MIFKEAVRSLKNGRSKAIFFALTFFLTTALLFFYFNMAESASAGREELYVTAGNLADLSQLLMKGNIGNLMMVFVVVMCSIDLFFCNDFFVKHKAKELAVRLICGATYIQMAMYILIQTVLLMAVAIPLGIAAGYGLLQLMNVILASQSVSLVITVDSFALVEFVCVMIFIIFWTTLLNCSFAYKSGAVLLAGGNVGALMKKQSGYGITNTKAFQFLLNVLGVLLALLPLYSFFQGSSGLAVIAVIGCVGLNRVIVEILLPLLTRHNRKKGTADTVAMTADGFLRRDITFSKMTVYLLIADLLVMMTMLFARENTAAEQLLIIVSYISISILQALTVMFRLETDLSSRKKEYVILSQVGTDDTQQKQIMKKEITRFYLFVLAVLVLYPGMALLALYLGGHAQLSMIILLAAAALLPLAVVYVLSLVYYRNVLKD